MISASRIELNTVACRSGDVRDLFPLHLEPADWIVFDFTDGRRSVKEMARILPLDKDAILQSLERLNSMGVIRIEHVSSMNPAVDNGSTMLGSAASVIAQNTGASTGGSSGWGSTFVSASSNDRNADIDIAMADLSDEDCLKYIPRRLLPNFRAFTPEIASADLDMDLGKQAIIEFLARSLDSMKPWEVLGIEENSDSNTIRQAYIRRSRMFHPDRYFRKNIGQFSGLLANVFKAISQAFNALSKT